MRLCFNVLLIDYRLGTLTAPFSFTLGALILFEGRAATVWTLSTRCCDFCATIRTVFGILLFATF